jgi:hypothetical protein
MKFLEEHDLEHLKPKFAGKVMSEVLENYIHLQEPEYKTDYIGKISSSDFRKLTAGFYDNLDLFGLDKLKDVRFSAHILTIRSRNFWAKM